MRNEEIVLVTKYKDGKEIKEFTSEVYAEKKSLTRSEFYAAISVGLEPKYVLNINTEEFYNADKVQDGITYHASFVRYEGREMRIIRAYELSTQSMDMTVG